MKRRFALIGLLGLAASTVLPIEAARAQSLVLVLYSGEAHVYTHRCGIVNNEVGGGCGALKKGASLFDFFASAKKTHKTPDAAGNPKTGNCFAVKIPLAGKTFGPQGPLCDINIVGGVTGPGTGNTKDNCIDSAGLFAGTFAIYDNHDTPSGGSKKTSSFSGVFTIVAGIGVVDGTDAKNSKPQGGPFISVFGLGLKDADTLLDCTDVVEPKDDPTQVEISGFAIEPQGF